MRSTSVGGPKRKAGRPFNMLGRQRRDSNVTLWEVVMGHTRSVAGQTVALSLMTLVLGIAGPAASQTVCCLTEGLAIAEAYRVPRLSEENPAGN